MLFVIVRSGDILIVIMMTTIYRSVLFLVSFENDVEVNAAMFWASSYCVQRHN